MSETPTESEKKQRFFLEIERVFLGLRGSPLLLSPADWQVAAQWCERGIPLGVVVEALEDLFRDLNERQPNRKVNSLRYCKPAVEELWQQRLELSFGAASLEARPSAAGEVGKKPSARASDVSVDEAAQKRLDELALQLPEELPNRQAWSERLRQLKGSRTVVEGQLGELELELLAALEGALDAEQREEIDRKLDKAVAPWGATLQPEEQRSLRARLLRNFLRDHYQLPVFTQL